MSDEECKVFWIFIVPLTWFFCFGIGWVYGHDTTITGTRQTLCREFMKETPDYINCNTKGMDEIIKIIKEQTNERNRLLQRL